MKMFFKRLIKAVLLILVCSTAAFLLLSLMLLNYVESPVDFRERAMTVEIPTGVNFARVTDILQEADLIRHPRAFYAYALIRKAASRIRAGEYDLASSMSPSEILDALVEGRVKGYPVMIPEGFTMRRIADRLAEKGIVDRDRFMAVATDPAFLMSQGIEGGSAEGYLFPDTYIFSRAVEEERVIRFMLDQLRRRLTGNMILRMDQLDMTMGEVLTLASIIEKEGGPPDEKPLISAVFHNRLERGMKLQSDPTIIYGMDDFDGNLKREDLKMDTPYNTYIIRGLPPGPICSPGLEAITAALYPAEVNYLYFVSKNDGTHHFSSNLTDHNKAVIKYQIRRRK